MNRSPGRSEAEALFSGPQTPAPDNIGPDPENRPGEASERLPEPLRATPIAPPTRDGGLIHPRTGELFDPREASDDTLADFIDAVRDWEGAAKVAKRIAGAVILSRMDANASWTQRTSEGWVIKGQSPEQYEWAVDPLRDTLNELVKEGKITPDAKAAAVKEKTEYQVMAGGVKALLKLGGEVKARILQHRHKKPPESRSVPSLSREPH